MPQINVEPSTKPAFALGAALSEAKTAKRRGNTAMAAFHFGRVLRHFPANPRARRGLKNLGPEALSALIENARELQAQGSFHESEEFWSCAVMLRPDHADLGLALAHCRIDLGRNHEALEAVEHVLKHNPDKANALDTKGRILRDLGQVAEAEAYHQSAMEMDSAGAGPLNNLGILAQSHGETCKAEGYFRRAISLRSDLPDLHYNLSRCVDYTNDESHLTQMKELAASMDAKTPGLAALHFALFNAYDSLGCVDQAFSHLMTGNRLRKTESQYDIRSEAIRFNWFQSLFEKPVTPVTTQSSASPRPIFVVGLPRSGTTLVERILSRTCNCQAAGELSVVSHAVAPLLRRLEQTKAHDIVQKDLLALRASLLSGLKRNSDGSSVIIDKMPLNFRWVGFICAALPEAKIVSLSRDPTAVGWSLYRHLFAGPGNGFAYDLGDIAAYSMLHKNMMQFWSARFQNRIIDLNYKDLTETTEPTIRNLVADCELPWSNDCLEPQHAKTSVRTASSSQVQKPVFQNSDLGWRKYQRHLEPLDRALRSANLT